MERLDAVRVCATHTPLSLLVCLLLLLLLLLFCFSFLYFWKLNLRPHTNARKSCFQWATSPGRLRTHSLNQSGFKLAIPPPSASQMGSWDDRPGPPSSASFAFQSQPPQFCCFVCCCKQRTEIQMLEELSGDLPKTEAHRNFIVILLIGHGRVFLEAHFSFLFFKVEINSQ